MNLMNIAKMFGVVLLIVGVLGFVPGVTNNQMLLGVFHVNPAHNMVHIATGAIALWAGMTSESAARIFFQAFGVVYGLVALLGFFVREGMIFGLISNNMADTWLHVAISAMSLYLGFAFKRETRLAM